jgi:hypothetical protein
MPQDRNFHLTVEDYLKYNNLSHDYESFSLFQAVVALPGVDTTVINFETDAGRPGGIVNFTFGFQVFTPAPISYSYYVRYDNTNVPKSLSGINFNMNDYINQKINYFIEFERAGKHVFSYHITNTGIVNIFPTIKIEGFYLKAQL